MGPFLSSRVRNLLTVPSWPLLTMVHNVFNSIRTHGTEPSSGLQICNCREVGPDVVIGLLMTFATAALCGTPTPTPSLSVLQWELRQHLKACGAKVLLVCLATQSIACGDSMRIHVFKHVFLKRSQHMQFWESPACQRFRRCCLSFWR